MRTILLSCSAAALSMFAASTAIAATLFTSSLSGAQEVPPTGSPNTGSADYTLRISGVIVTSLEFDMLFSPAFNFGVPGSTGTQIVSGLHIHEGPRGVNGPVVFGLIGLDDDDDDDIVYTLLTDGSTRITGEWDTTEGRGGTTFADFASIFAGTGPGADTPFYLNLHTNPDFPGGEIRGQIVAAPIPLPATLPLLVGALLLVRRKRGN